jgi:hypothetical protein
MEWHPPSVAAARGGAAGAAVFSGVFFLAASTGFLLTLTCLQQHGIDRAWPYASGIRATTNCSGDPAAAAAAAATPGGGGADDAAAAAAAAAALQLLMETRVCGSPAVDGYAYVNASCLLESPTARWWRAWTARGGRPEVLVAHLEPESDIDGIAVKWGIGNKHASAEACAADCWRHRPGAVEGPFSALPCNAFSWCGADVCFQPDAHNHTRGDCWLKWTEAAAAPEINFRGGLPPTFRARHPKAPARVEWHAGVLLPPGVEYTNGSFSPRYYW